jgi:PIN domain nuclease of toxin-antitoxin system
MHGREPQLTVPRLTRGWLILAGPGGGSDLLTIADLATWWRRATELTAARVLPIRASHVTALAALPMLHKDPFDRILIAQAVAEGLPFLTNDDPIDEYPVRTIW